MTKAREPKPPRPKRADPANKTNPTTGGFQISDELWEILEPLILEHVNTHRLGGGRPRVPDRTCANGIFYVLRIRLWRISGKPWMPRASAPVPRRICAFRNGWPLGCSWNCGELDWSAMTN